MPMKQTRRRFLTTLSLAGAAGFMRGPSALAAEGLLETTTVRISKDLAICEAPLEIAEELLRADGFTDIRYVDTSMDDLSAAIAQRKVDFALDFPVLFAPGIDAGKPVTVLAGVHVGCFELFARNDVRTIAKATDLCATEPMRVARSLIDGGFAPRYDYALQTLNDIPYNNWREYDAEDTIRFYALRLHEAGMIKATPQKIIADGTDWRFLNELKRELKA
jgi:hypothetical protein